MAAAGVPHLKTDTSCCCTPLFYDAVCPLLHCTVCTSLSKLILFLNLLLLAFTRDQGLVFTPVSFASQPPSPELLGPNGSGAKTSEDRSPGGGSGHREADQEVPGLPGTSRRFAREKLFRSVR